MSTIKVHGEATLHAEPFREDSPMRPTDPYSRSKCLAEEYLNEVARETRMEVTVIRPPVVYGYGSTGSLSHLVKLIRARVPLPFGALVGNRRSLVSVENLSSLIYECVMRKEAAHRTFVVSDGQHVSTRDLLTLLASIVGVPVLLPPVPETLIRTV